MFFFRFQNSIFDVYTLWLREYRPSVLVIADFLQGKNALRRTPSLPASLVPQALKAGLPLSFSDGMSLGNNLSSTALTGKF